MTEHGVLTRDECDDLFKRVFELLRASRAQVGIVSQAISSSEFALGSIHSTRETRSLDIVLALEVGGRQVRVRTNRIDDDGLRVLVERAETAAGGNPTPEALSVLPPQEYAEGPPIHFDSSSAALAPVMQASVVEQATTVAEAAGLVAAGELEVEVRVRAVGNTSGLSGFESQTYGEFSMTARSPDNGGSGWAWSGFEDWGRVHVEAVIGRAIDLAERSAEPVAIEPGRYTVILEPAAVAELLHQIIGPPTQYWSGPYADSGLGVFSKDPLGTNKIGLQMIDRRLGMVSDPWDPQRPASVISTGWFSIPGPVTWFDQGILRSLAYDPSQAGYLDRAPVINPGGVRLEAEGPATSAEDMIAATRRGVWVNRLSHVVVMDAKTLLLTGTTRDGTFLIENGRITRPIKNFRFTESPFFVLNQLEAWGDPVRASRLVVAPRLKLRDFNFTSLTDAI